MKKLLTMLVLVLGFFSFTLADDCRTVESRFSTLKQRMYDIQIKMNDLEYKMATDVARRAMYLRQYQDEANNYNRLYSDMVTLQAEADRCITKENQAKNEVSILLTQWEYEMNSKDYKAALSTYKEVLSKLDEITWTEDMKVRVKNYIKDLEKAIDTEEWVYKLFDMEKRAYEYAQNKEIDRAYNLYKEIVSYEWKHEYDYTTAKAALKDLEKIKELQKEMEEVEKAQKKAEEKAKVEAEQKAYLEEVEKAKTALWKDAPIIESISRAPKLQDKKMREKILALCQSWKKSNKARNKNFWIYLEYLLTKED